MSGIVKRSKTCLSLDEKLDVIFFHERTKCSMRQLAKEFNIGKTQAGAIIRKRDKYFELWKSDSDELCLRSKTFSCDSVGLMIDQYVYGWYTQTNNKKTPVTGSAMQSKALEAAKKLGKRNFRASIGWLERFKKRHNIVLKQPCKKKSVNVKSEILNDLETQLETEKIEPSDDKSENICNGEFQLGTGKSESSEVKSASLDDWERQLRTVMSNYSSDDIYCIHETGLFFQAIPEDVINLRCETCAYGKLPSERFTVLLCTSIKGIKELPLVITKEEIVSDSDNILDCDFDSNSMAWMTCDIMTKWLKKMDKEMTRQKRKICLFLNDTPVHKSPSFSKLKNIKVIYFPTDKLGESQPMNHGIVQAFKMHYRLLMLHHLISQTDLNDGEKNSVVTIDLSMAISWIKSSWDAVSRSLIERNFKNSGFDQLTLDINQSDNEPSLNEVAELLCAYDSDVDAAEYVNIDSNLATEAEYMEMISDRKKMVDIKGNGRKKKLALTQEPIKKMLITSCDEAMESLKCLEDFYLFRNDASSVLLINKLIKKLKADSHM